MKLSVRLTASARSVDSLWMIEVSRRNESLELSSSCRGKAGPRIAEMIGRKRSWHRSCVRLFGCSLTRAPFVCRSHPSPRAPSTWVECADRQQRHLNTVIGIPRRSRWIGALHQHCVSLHPAAGSVTSDCAIAPSCCCCLDESSVMADRWRTSHSPSSAIGSNLVAPIESAGWCDRSLWVMTRWLPA